jgi:hypothetical protein
VGRVRHSYARVAPLLVAVLAGAVFLLGSQSSAAAQGAVSAPECRPLRAVFYAEQEWLRLAAKLAEHASPCAEYYVSIPPIVGDKTNFRPDQAWRIRANGPNFHALAEVQMNAWRHWATDNNSTWYQAGVEARRRMAVAGFDVTLGDDWIVNEFSSGVRRGNGVARTEARDFVRGLHDGDAAAPTKGGVFDIGMGQGGSGPGATDLSVYKSQLEGWLQDDAFWEDMQSYVSDWSQELYGDVRNYAVPGSALPTRRDFLNDYLQHELVHARVGGAPTAAARSFLESAYSPLANAAWQWDFGFGWTMVSAEQMEDYVSAQVYALRHFSALDGQAEDHWGFAWHARNITGLPPDEFASLTGAIMDRLATAIHDSAEPLDPADPGSGACAPPGQNVWCSTELDGAWLNDSWKTFTYWGLLALGFATPPQSINAGSVSAPISIETRLAGSTYATPSALAVSLASSSSQGRFSTSPGGPWAPTLTTTLPAGSATTPSVYYTDTLAGTPVLTASAVGTDSGAQTETVVEAAPPPPPPPPPPPAPPPVPSRPPRITSARLGESRRRHVIEVVRFRVCDESEGRLLARVQQTLTVGGHRRAKGSFTRALASAGGCRSYKVQWRVRNAFLSSGIYTVRLQIRDSEGAWSAPVQRSRIRKRAR